MNIADKLQVSNLFGLTTNKTYKKSFDLLLHSSLMIIFELCIDMVMHKIFIATHK